VKTFPERVFSQKLEAEFKTKIHFSPQKRKVELRRRSPKKLETADEKLGKVEGDFRSSLTQEVK